jgi:ion channel-forming bestrophin family protein
MITYDSRNWIAALALHRSDTFRKLFPMLMAVAIFTWLVGYIETEYFHLSNDNENLVRNLPVMHSLMGFAISMLLVFRTNTAYDRWWEARKLWGQLVNVSRNTAIKLAAILPQEDQRSRAWFALLIGRFAHALQLHLRSEKTRVALDTLRHPELEGLDPNRHLPAQIAALMHARVHRAYREGVISGDQLIGLASDLSAFMDICGACERIKNTPIPYTYSSFLKKFIVIYSLTLPFGFVFSLGYIAVPVVVFIFYVLASMEIIAEEIEDPFGSDANDLPLDRLTEIITANTSELLA